MSHAVAAVTSGPTTDYKAQVPRHTLRTCMGYIACTQTSVDESTVTILYIREELSGRAELSGQEEWLASTGSSAHFDELLICFTAAAHCSRPRDPMSDLVSSYGATKVPKGAQNCHPTLTIHQLLCRGAPNVMTPSLPPHLPFRSVDVSSPSRQRRIRVANEGSGVANEGFAPGKEGCAEANEGCAEGKEGFAHANQG